MTALLGQDVDVVFMREALKEAKKAFDEDEVPVGAVLVVDGRIVARGRNQVELLSDATAHAEMICLSAGAAQAAIPCEGGFDMLWPSEAQPNRSERARSLHPVQGEREGSIWQSRSRPEHVKSDGARYNWRLGNATLYCTLEPCSMCAGAMFLSRLKRLVWAAPDLRVGANGSWIDLFSEKHPIHTVEVVSGILQEEAADLMRTFFQKQRKKNEKAD